MKDEEIKELKRRGFNLDEIYQEKGKIAILNEKSTFLKKKMSIGIVIGILSLIRVIGTGLSLISLLDWSPISGLYIRDFSGDTILTKLLFIGILHVVLIGIGVIIIFAKKPVGGIIIAIGFIFDLTAIFFVKDINMFPAFIYDIILIVCSIGFFITARK